MKRTVPLWIQRARSTRATRAIHPDSKRTLMTATSPHLSAAQGTSLDALAKNIVATLPPLQDVVASNQMHLAQQPSIAANSDRSNASLPEEGLWIDGASNNRKSGESPQEGTEIYQLVGNNLALLLLSRLRSVGSMTGSAHNVEEAAEEFQARERFWSDKVADGTGVGAAAKWQTDVNSLPIDLLQVLARRALRYLLSRPVQISEASSSSSPPLTTLEEASRLDDLLLGSETISIDLGGSSSRAPGQHIPVASNNKAQKIKDRAKTNLNVMLREAVLKSVDSKLGRVSSALSPHLLAKLPKDHHDNPETPVGTVQVQKIFFVRFVIPEDTPDRVPLEKKLLASGSATLLLRKGILVYPITATSDVVQATLEAPFLPSLVDVHNGSRGTDTDDTDSTSAADLSAHHKQQDKKLTGKLKQALKDARISAAERQRQTEDLRKRMEEQSKRSKELQDTLIAKLTRRKSVDVKKVAPASHPEASTGLVSLRQSALELERQLKERDVRLEHLRLTKGELEAKISTLEQEVALRAQEVVDAQRRTSLERDADHSATSAELQRVRHENDLLQRATTDLQDQKTTLEAAKAKAQETLAEVQAKSRDGEKIAFQTAARFAEEKRQLQRDLDESNSRTDALNSEIHELQQKIERQKEHWESVAAQQQEKLAKSSGSSAADFEAQLAKIHSQNQNRVDSLEADLLNAQRLAHEQQSSHSEKEEKLLAQISKMESDLDAARTSLEKQLVEAAEALQSAVGRHRAVETELNATIDALRESHLKMSQAKALADSELGSKIELVGTLEEKLDMATADKTRMAEESRRQEEQHQNSLKLLQAEVDSLAKEKAAIQEKLIALQETSNRAMESQKTSQEEVQSASRLQFSQMSKELDAKGAALVAVEAQLAELTQHHESSLAETRTQVKIAQEELQSEKNQGSEVVAVLQREISQLTLSLAEVKGQVESLTMERTALRTDLSDLRHALESAASATAESLQADHAVALSVLLEERDKVARELDRVNLHVRTTEDQLVQLSESTKVQGEALNHAQRSLEEEREKYASLEEQLRRSSAVTAEAQDAALLAAQKQTQSSDVLLEKISTLEAQLADDRQTISQLEASRMRSAQEAKEKEEELQRILSEAESKFVVVEAQSTSDRAAATEALAEQANTHSAERAAWRQQSDKEGAAIKELQAALDVSRALEIMLQKDHAATEEKRRESEAQVGDLLGRIAILESQGAKLRAQLDDQGSTLRKYVDEEAVLVAERSALRDKLGTVEKEAQEEREVFSRKDADWIVEAERLAEALALAKAKADRSTVSLSAELGESSKQLQSALDQANLELKCLQEAKKTHASENKDLVARVRDLEKQIFDRRGQELKEQHDIVGDLRAKLIALDNEGQRKAHETERLIKEQDRLHKLVKLANSQAAEAKAEKVAMQTMRAAPHEPVRFTPPPLVHSHRKPGNLEEVDAAKITIGALVQILAVVSVVYLYVTGKAATTPPPSTSRRVMSKK